MISPLNSLRVSITARYLLVTLITGLIVWGILNHFQQKQLSELLSNEATNSLKHQSANVSQRFYEVISRHERVVQLLSQIEPVAHYLEDYAAGKSPETLWSDYTVPWHGLATPDHIVLYDRHFVPAFSWAARKNQLVPGIFLNDTSQLIENSTHNNYITYYLGKPVMLISSPVIYEEQGIIGYILMAIHLNKNFMRRSLLEVLPENASALILSNKFGSQITAASTHPHLFPIGTTLENIEQDYFISTKSFFDQGDWAFNAGLAVVVPKTNLDTLLHEVEIQSQHNRAIMALVLLGMFAILITLLSRRLIGLGWQIRNFAEDQLGKKLVVDTNIDLIQQASQSFDALAKEIAKAREADLLKFRVERSEGQLEILQQATETLNVGVLKKEGQDWTPFNRAMEYMVELVCDADDFAKRTGPNQSILDRNGTRHIYDITRLESAGTTLILVSETTELALKSEELSHMALHDALTGLPNRFLFRDRLKHEIKGLSRNDSQFALLLIDLDKFKPINDTLGHAVGDQVLVEIAYRLSQHLRSNDTLARIGGDEFALLLPGADEQRASMIAARLSQALHEPLYLPNHELEVLGSIGIALAPSQGSTADKVMSYADMAMYHAKRDHLGYFVYDESIDTTDQNRLELQTYLHQSIARHQLVLEYQPQFNLKDGSIHQWEALIRWQHPQLGLLTPDVFIPIAEDTGFIRDISRWVLEQAIRDCSQWQKAGIPGSVSVNLCQKDLQDVRISSLISGFLEAFNLPADQLTVEITETMIMQNPVETKHTINALSRHGVQIALDDFGTGYSSLSHIQELPLNEIKIDRSFVHDMTIDQDDAAIVRAVIGLSHSLGLIVVAEGVEDEDTASRLSFLQCDYVQGFYFSRSIKFESMADFIESKKRQQPFTAYLKP